MNNVSDNKVPVIGIARHRLATDGNGVTTLVAFHGCPLRCKYCLNPQSLGDDKPRQYYTAASLYNEVNIDNLYFIATEGGVTFGGGEPCLRHDFILQFKELCGNDWKLTLETSLNVPQRFFSSLLPIIDNFIVDVKDMNSKIYQLYTGKDNHNVLDNLKLLIEHNRQHDTIIRLPLIPSFNTEEDRIKSRSILENMGFHNFDIFTYTIK